MSEDFKNKLRAYAEGKLSPEEKAEVERELEKLEEYQAFLEAELAEDDPQQTQKAPENTAAAADKKEARIISRAKWKARIHNALTALAILFAGTVICGILTSVYYGAGDPPRGSVYPDVVKSAIAVTEPNAMVGGAGTGVNPFFNMDFKGQLGKQIGSEKVNAGEVQATILFNRVTRFESKRLIDAPQTWPFTFPMSAAMPMKGDWAKLAKLPEGTVAEAYLSFDRLYPTDEVLKKLKDKTMRPVWFIVDTGFEDVSAPRWVSSIGFPYQPLLHYSDWTVTNRTYKKVGLFTTVESQLAAGPNIEEYGSAEFRNKNFLETLELLKKYEKIANQIAPGGDLRLQERIKYLQSHGVKIYGAVVTGPSKEILKLKKEAWVAGIYLGEVRLWNWEG